MKDERGQNHFDFFSWNRAFEDKNRSVAPPPISRSSLHAEDAVKADKYYCA